MFPVGRREFFLEELGCHCSDLPVHGFTVDAWIVHAKSRDLLLPGFGASVKECIMADPAWQDGEFRALNVRSEKLCIFTRRSNWIGGAYDNVHGDRDVLQTLRCKRP